MNSEADVRYARRCYSATGPTVDVERCSHIKYLGTEHQVLRDQIEY